MLTVVIETRDNAEPLARTLASLVPGAVDGIVREVMVCDLGSTDGTDRVAEHAGCQVVTPGALRESLGRAKGEWLLLLKPGSRLSEGWIEAVREHVERHDGPARFSVRGSAIDWFRRLSRGAALSGGLLVRRRQALGLLGNGGGLRSLGRLSAKRLAVRIVPARPL